MKKRPLHPSTRAILSMLREWRSAKHVYQTRDTTKSSVCRLLNELVDEGLLERRVGAKPARGLQGYDYKLTKKGDDRLEGREPVAQVTLEKVVQKNPWENLRYPILERGRT